MKFITDINNLTLDQFVLNHNEYSHFLQSSAWINVQASNGFKCVKLGVLDDSNKLIAAGLFVVKKIKFTNKEYLYSPRGPILDYNNKELLSYFSNQLNKYLKEHKYAYAIIDPCVEIESDLIPTLNSIGYKHMGLNVAFENNQPRFTFKIALTKGIEEIESNYHSKTKKALRIAKNSFVRVKKYGIDDIDTFYSLMKTTALRDNFFSYNKDYYLSFYKCLNENNESDLYLAEVNVEGLYNHLNKQLNNEVENNKQIENKINDKASKKMLNKKKESDSRIKSIEKQLDEVSQVVKDNKKVIISGIITAKTNNKVWTIHGGNDNILRDTMANYLVYHQIIIDACNQGLKTFDFFGTIGEEDQTHHQYGIHLFKKRYGGRLVEYIGEFHMINSKFYYWFNTKLLRFIRNLKSSIVKKLR